MCIMLVDFSILFQLSVLILTYHKYKTLFSVLVLYNISYSIYVYVPILVIGYIYMYVCVYIYIYIFVIWKYFHFWIYHPQKIKQYLKWERKCAR
jgi:hypothetical protein